MPNVTLSSYQTEGICFGWGVQLDSVTRLPRRRSGRRTHQLVENPLQHLSFYVGTVNNA